VAYDRVETEGVATIFQKDIKQYKDEKLEKGSEGINRQIDIDVYLREAFREKYKLIVLYSR
jgi:hypothetical protein